jgi:hypothetical protein
MGKQAEEDKERNLGSHKETKDDGVKDVVGTLMKLDKPDGPH